MAKISRPNNSDEVLDVMSKYNKKCNFGYSEAQLQYLAESCFLSFEAKGWIGIKYWPPLAMKWVLNNKTEFGKKTPFIPKAKSKDKTVREQIMEERDA